MNVVIKQFIPRCMSAAPFATSVPWIPIATPMSAWFKAGASFTWTPGLRSCAVRSLLPSFTVPFENLWNTLNISQYLSISLNISQCSGHQPCHSITSHCSNLTWSKIWSFNMFQYRKCMCYIVLPWENEQAHPLHFIWGRSLRVLSHAKWTWHPRPALTLNALHNLELVLVLGITELAKLAESISGAASQESRTYA